jgi:hypothetical protein
MLRWKFARRQRVAWLLALGALILSARVTARETVRERGQALFAGREPLKGKVRGHQSELPPAVVVCRNCHAAQKQVQTPAPAPAPPIDRSLLLEARPRRGGPPSSYDRAAFCKLLRTGIDPAYVLVAREMPVFDLDDAQCVSLWRFLTDETGPR